MEECENQEQKNIPEVRRMENECADDFSFSSSFLLLIRETLSCLFISFITHYHTLLRTKEEKVGTKEQFRNWEQKKRREKRKKKKDRRKKREKKERRRKRED